MNTIKCIEPKFDCKKCNRLYKFRKENVIKFPNYYNKPVRSFGSKFSKLLIIGLAPGLQGANKTGRPFTGDFAGELLYSTLLKFNLAKGFYDPKIKNDLKLKNCRITNVVKCVPPKNKPEGTEVKNCRSFLSEEINAMKNLKIILCLGVVSHNSTIKSFGLKPKNFIFSHGKKHKINEGVVMINSYHCSRYNTNTGRLNKKMFEEVFKKINKLL